MKKLFTLLAVALMAFSSASAQSRLTYDFRHWSQNTLNALAQDMEVNGPTANWRNYESDATKADQQHYWIARKMAGTLVTNDGTGDKPIPETNGINFGASNAKKLVIAYNHNNKGEEGGSFIWFNGKKEKMTIPNVNGGVTMHVGIESHSGSEARGFDITFNGTALKNNEGGNFVPVAYTEYDVDLPEGQGDLVFTTTNGCHLYYVILGEGDAPKSSTVGYLTSDLEGFKELPLYKAVCEMEGVTFQGIDVASATAEQLKSYDAVVIDSNVEANESNVAFLKQNIQWQPVLNVSGDLAEALGFGTKVEISEDELSEFAIATNLKKNWFTNVNLEDIDNLGSMGMGLTYGEVFPTPLILQGNHATDNKYLVWADGDFVSHADSVIGYIHNEGHNAYAYYGVAGDYSEDTYPMIQNIISDLIESKSAVEQTPAPQIKGTFKEMETTATITDVNKNAVIYYTIDGTDPTVESPVYTEPLVFNQPATVKAIAIADGYEISSVSEFEVEMFHAAKNPIIDVTDGGENKDATITISSEENVDIYYNFTGAGNPVSKYTEPFSIRDCATIYAYAIGAEGEALVQSEWVEQQIFANTKKVRRDEVAHFKADKTWATLSTDETPSLVLNGTPQTAWANSSNYYFSWGKTAQPSSENIGDPLIDPNTGEPMMDENGNFIYEQKAREAEVTTNAQDPDWKFVSQGQVMIHQVISIGKDVGNGEGYNPDSATDLINVSYMTANCVQCAAKASGDKYTARIESTKKYQAPFNVLYFAGTAKANEKTAVQISADGENWTTVGDTVSCSATMRLWKQFEVSYEGTDEVYVRVAHIATGSAAQIYDIYIFNEGEKSKAMMEEYATGISETVAPEVKKVIRGTYNLAGQKVSANYKGIIIANGKKYIK